jgi:hypothetical protein
VHPKTGKVCVPIQPAAADAFDPDGVPVVWELLAEAEAAARQGGGEGWVGTGRGLGWVGQGPTLAAHARLVRPLPSEPRLLSQAPWQATRLAPSIVLFEEAFLAPLTAANKRDLAARARTQAAVASSTLEF